MISSRVLWLVLNAAILPQLLFAHDDDEVNGPLVSTKNGDVRGKYIVISRNQKVSAFLGIPFAKPPVGELRFADPVPVPPWKPNVIETKQHKPACFQIFSNPEPGFRGYDMWALTTSSEDCLYVNVWVRSEAKFIDRLPVMVWIYGGSFRTGGSSMELYDPTTLAGTTGVIVVSFNYRLGPLGFLPPMGRNSSGNAGFLDQVLALKWVQENIESFGGDPDKVTIFGESAGAASTGLHMVSPLSRGLFHRVIQQSGNQLADWAVMNLETSKNRMKSIAGMLSCEANDESQILSCLRSKTAVEVVGASWLTISSGFENPFLPAVGTESIPEDPKLTFSRGHQAPVDVLIGWNENEGALWNMFAMKGFNRRTHSLVTKEQYMENIVLLNVGPVAEEAIAFFYADWETPSNFAQYRDGLNEMASDAHYACPTIEMAKLHHQLANVYMYHLTYRLSTNPWPKWMGVTHGFELELVFGFPFSHDRFSSYNDQDREVSRRIIRYWSNFAKFGNPNGPYDREFSEQSGNTYWPSVVEDKLLYLELFSNQSYVRHSPNAFRCAFWSNYIPSLKAASATWSNAESRWKLQLRRWENSMNSWESSYHRYSNKHTTRNCP